MRETMSNRSLVIASDDRPLRWYVERLVSWVKEQRVMSLRAVVEQSLASGEATKPLLIGSFCALLELMKMGVVGVQQAHPQAEIMIHLREDVEGDAENLIRMAGFGDEVPANLADALAEPPARSVPPGADESAAEG
jgi:chromatin segregation and condensation protein Rec8/ScpA/Scc1 (kleisin family)